MNPESPAQGGPLGRVRLVVASLLVCLLAGLSLVALADGARKAKILGAENNKQKPTCPKGKCLATGKVTGFQTSIGGDKKVFKAPSDGHIVGWSIDLAKPDKETTEFFEDKLESKQFGTDPYARIAVLNPKGKGRFTLAKQTPAVDLSGSLGSRPVFTLNDPVKVKKGRILALTIPSWTTNFVGAAGSESQWLGSRSSKRCNLATGNAEKDAENLAKSRPQMKVGSTKKYGCRYNGERLLYWVYLLPKKNKDGGKKD